MIQFSELRISDCKRKIYVGCEVENFDIYSGVYIKSVYIDYYKNRLASGSPSENAICLYDNTNDNYNIKSVYVTLDSASLQDSFGTHTFANGLFYVYVICDVHGNSLATADCGWDSMTTVGIIADWEKVWREGMMYIGQVANSCSTCTIKDGFIDFILRWEALKLAMATCDYETVDMMWDGLIGNTRAASTGGCGCS